MTMRHDCVHKGCYLHKHVWDWAILDGCFTGRIEPTDVDGLVERHGQYLLLECKGRNVVALERGQQIVFRDLARRHGFTVMVLFGDRNKPMRATIFHPGGRVEAGIPVDLDGVRERVAGWFLAADAVAAS